MFCALCADFRHDFARDGCLTDKTFTGESFLAKSASAAGGATNRGNDVYTRRMNLPMNLQALAEPAAWKPINDGVMGGLSHSRFLVDEEGCARFEGTVSLENQGGFASVRHVLRQLVPANSRQIRLRALGDGHVYKFSLRTDDAFDGISYQADFLPASHQWMDIDLGLDQFAATFRGRPASAAALTSFGQIRQIGLMIANRQVGDFCLKLRLISFL